MCVLFEKKVCCKNDAIRGLGDDYGGPSGLSSQKGTGGKPL